MIEYRRFSLVFLFFPLCCYEGLLTFEKLSHSIIISLAVRLLVVYCSVYYIVPQDSQLIVVGVRITDLHLGHYLRYCIEHNNKGVCQRLLGLHKAAPVSEIPSITSHPPYQLPYLSFFEGICGVGIHHRTTTPVPYIHYTFDKHSCQWLC